MILGTVVGVAQTNLKRMLAYSSIAHGGYLLVGLVAANEVGKAAILFYLLVVRGDQSRRLRRHRAARHAATAPNDELRDYAGLWHEPSRPGGADDGLPAVARRLSADRRASSASGTSSARPSSAGYYWLAIIGVLTSVISVFFYLRVVVMMYMAEPRRARCVRASASSHWARWRSRRRDLLSRRPAHARARPGSGVGRNHLLERVPGSWYVGSVQRPRHRTSTPRVQCCRCACRPPSSRRSRRPQFACSNSEWQIRAAAMSFGSVPQRHESATAPSPPESEAPSSAPRSRCGAAGTQQSARVASRHRVADDRTSDDVPEADEQCCTGELKRAPDAPLGSPSSDAVHRRSRRADPPELSSCSFAPRRRPTMRRRATGSPRPAVTRGGPTRQPPSALERQARRAVSPVLFEPRVSRRRLAVLALTASSAPPRSKRSPPSKDRGRRATTPRLPYYRTQKIVPTDAAARSSTRVGRTPR